MAKVKLIDTQGNNLRVCKVLHNQFGYGLKEAKDIVESTPRVVKECFKTEDALMLADCLRYAGANAIVE